MANNTKPTVSTTVEDVRMSVASLYSNLLEKRKAEHEEHEEQKRLKREEREREKQEKENEDDTKKSKKERREAELENWKEVIVGLTGDDLEYITPKKTKKKYKKWIDDEEGANVVLTQKPKKIKKRNYHKEFEPEINMLKSIVADQNKFTNDLQRRFNNAVGPATKDAPAPNKTIVELASVINSGRMNSLGYLREIGNLKKNIADLYMKQKKLDADLGGSGGNIGNGDLTLMGSNIASRIFGDDLSGNVSSGVSNTGTQYQTSSGGDVQPISSGFTYQSNATAAPITPGETAGVQVESFDPSSWEGPSLDSNCMTIYENIPHEVIVEMNSSTGASRFKAINTETGDEIVGYPVPEEDLNKLKFNTKDKVVKGDFDESYKLEII